jgi:hypothetical protein
MSSVTAYLKEHLDFPPFQFARKDISMKLTVELLNKLLRDFPISLVYKFTSLVKLIDTHKVALKKN